MTIARQTSIALLREELEQQRTRAEAAEAELRELRMKHGALATVAKTAVANATEVGHIYCRLADVERLAELLADEGGEWVEKAHCDTIEGELRDLRRVVDAIQTHLQGVDMESLGRLAEMSVDRTHSIASEQRFAGLVGRHAVALVSAAREALRHA